MLKAWDHIEAPQPRALASISLKSLNPFDDDNEWGYLVPGVNLVKAGKDAVEWGYEKGFKGPAEQQKRAGAKAARDLDELGWSIGQKLNAGRQRARGNYGNAMGAIANYGANAPTTLRDRYSHRQQNRPVSALDNLSKRVYGTPLQDLYSSGKIGKTPTDVENRYKTRAGNPATADQNLAAFVNGLKPVGNELRSRLSQREKAEDSLSTYMAGRLTAPKEAIETDKLMSLVGQDSARLSKDAAGYVDDYNEAARSKDFADAFTPVEKGYMEQFAERELGDGSEGQRVYDRLADQTQKRMQRAAAARGGFVSGASMRQEGEALADLAGQRYAQLADFADRGQKAQEGRLALGFGFQKDIDAMGLEKLGLGLTARKYGIDAATAADTTKAGLAKATDDTRTSRQSSLDRLATDTSGAEARRAEALDKLANDITTAAGNREARELDAANKRDTLSQTERRDLDLLAGKSSDSALDREDNLVEAAEGASNEIDRGRDDEREVAKEIDAYNEHYEDQLDSLADKVSEEQRKTLKDTADLYTTLGEKLANVDSEYDAREIQSQMAVALQKIQVELAASGIDAAMVQSLVNTLTAAGSLYLKAKDGGKN